MKITLYFGSFNPVHTGHMIIANHLLNFTQTEEVWMVISPQNPFKNQQNLADSYDRLHLVELAIGDQANIRTNTIEFDLPKPSYTIDTLTYLQEQYPEHEFALLVGSDNLPSFHKWKNYEMILKHYQMYVYERPGHVTELYKDQENVQFVEGPMLHISASFIRKLIREGRDIRYLVPDAVYHYLGASNLYKA